MPARDADGPSASPGGLCVAPGGVAGSFSRRCLPSAGAAGSLRRRRLAVSPGGGPHSTPGPCPRRPATRRRRSNQQANQAPGARRFRTHPRSHSSTESVAALGKRALVGPPEGRGSLPMVLVTTDRPSSKQRLTAWRRAARGFPAWPPGGEGSPGAAVGRAERPLDGLGAAAAHPWSRAPPGAHGRLRGGSGAAAPLSGSTDRWGRRTRGSAALARCISERMGRTRRLS
jgi:hypothetical protein